MFLLESTATSVEKEVLPWVNKSVSFNTFKKMLNIFFFNKRHSPGNEPGHDPPILRLYQRRSFFRRARIQNRRIPVSWLAAQRWYPVAPGPKTTVTGSRGWGTLNATTSPPPLRRLAAPGGSAGVWATAKSSRRPSTTLRSTGDAIPATLSPSYSGVCNRKHFFISRRLKG